MTAQLLNDILSAFLAAIDGGAAVLGALSLPLLGIVAVIAYYRTLGPQLAFGEARLGDALASFLLLIISFSIYLWILLHLVDMTNALFDTAVTWGGSAGGFASGQFLNPAAVLDTGFKLARPIRDYTDSFLKWLSLSEWPTLLLYTLSYYLIILAFGLIALALMMAMIEFHLAVMASCVLLPWGVLSTTAFLGEFAIGWVVGVTVRVFIMAAVVGIATPLFSRVQFTLSSGGDPTFYSAMLCGLTSGIFAILAWVIPNRAAALAGRGVSLALGASDLLAGAASGARVVLAGQGVIRGASRMLTGRG